MQNASIKRAILLVGDTISKLTQNNDRSTTPLFGDAGTATLLEKDTEKNNGMHFCLGADGNGCKNILVNQGAFRNPILHNEKPQLYMNGNEIFTFTLARIPGLITQILKDAAWKIDEVNYFIFHQANAFMLQYLRKKLKVPVEKFLMALEQFGNTSSASIPLTLINSFITSPPPPLDNKIILAGFGVGYSWGAVSLKWEKETILLPLIKI